jgi:nitrogen fixation protein NifZ
MFTYGQTVMLRTGIVNDGSFPGKAAGEVLAVAGDVGRVTRIATLGRRTLVYGVHFGTRGYTVGCSASELELAAAPAPVADGLAPVPPLAESVRAA